ncbi:MAG: hypothetical protein IJH84_04605, partial [Saccharopolyspora sp.]|uniref:hypothetical protein n=1 Tax=Saccharopolyspora sp. TaxID=33915 RepID=UPI0025F2EC2F
VPRVQARVATSGSASRKNLPIPDLAAAPGAAGVVYRIAAVDERGRIAERSVTHALGWWPGQRLQVGMLSAATLAIRPDPGGLCTLTRRGHIPVPLSARRWCHVQAADRVLLAATPEHDLLVIYTMAALEAMVTAFHSPADGGDAS